MPNAAAVRPVAYAVTADEASQSPLQTAHFETGGSTGQSSAAVSHAHAISFTPAEPRTDIITAGFRQPAAGPLTVPVDALARAYPDEYLCDGGDRDLPVHYDEFNRLGLDTEDAVAEYVDHLGENHVKPTNQVAIYAPRFGAMRTVSGTHSGTSIAQIGNAIDRTHGIGLRNRSATTYHSQRDGTDRLRMRSRAGGFSADAVQAGIDQQTKIAQHRKLINVYQDLTFIRTGRFKRAEEARLAGGIQAALSWQQGESPIIVASTAGSQEMRGEFKPQELIGLEDERRTKGDLRIVKMADKKTAMPGDVVTFTIRYDNLGDRELYHIRIVDNLTPRLVYIDDSATSDRAGQLVVEDNEEGSLVLRFELDEPLPGHTGGVVTFEARVR